MFGCSCGHIVQDRQKAEELITVQQKACVQQHSLESERVAFVHASNKDSHCKAYVGLTTLPYLRVCRVCNTDCFNLTIALISL